jgi:hypothetical protein
MRNLHRDDGVWHGRSGHLSFRWSGAAHAEVNDDGMFDQVIEVGPGDHHDLVLEMSPDRINGDPVRPDRCWTATEHAWHQAVPDLGTTIAPDDARQSYAVLRGMTSASGAMIAAPTMSMPERADTGRSYDYRYAWIRDQCYAGEAIGACGPHPLLDCAVKFVTERVLADGQDLKPDLCGRAQGHRHACTLAGRRTLDGSGGQAGGRHLAGLRERGGPVEACSGRRPGRRLPAPGQHPRRGATG